jgi:hypothetical protein
MNNRQQRRAARKGKPIRIIDIGTLQSREPNYGLPVRCYLCGADHNGYGLARIHDPQSANPPFHVPLCEKCRTSGDAANAVARKSFGAPDVKITEGGEVTTEQLTALADKQNSREH